jgi:hypothetical protein
MKFTQKGEFGAAMKGYVALNASRADQDEYRLDVIGAALWHGLRHANFDPRVVPGTLGAIRPDVQTAMSAARALWEKGGKVNFTEAEATKTAMELLQPVIAALRELRATQERNKQERKEQKDAEARAAAIAAREAEGKPLPSPYMLKGPDDGTVPLSSEEYDTLLGLLAEIRSGARPVTVDVTKRAERLAAAA